MASGLVAGPPEVEAQVSANVPSGAAKDRLNRLWYSTSASFDPSTGRLARATVCSVSDLDLADRP
jgi:hypothetical protein